MPLKLTNTLTHKKEIFTPLDKACVRLYVCGPTVYDAAHIGNARPYTVFDILYRLLKHLYPAVHYVRNITDIDDKIIQAAMKNQEPIAQLTQRTTQKFQEDMAVLGILPPDTEPRATEHIPEMIQLITALIDKGYAYVSEGHVLFQVKIFSAYGRLSRCSVEDMVAGARVDVAPYKRDPADFVLWKPSPREAHFPGWESPWGYGRPGWHIECSAMSWRYLGPCFDIHAGGQDLIFPHHENELAQSCGAHGTEQMAQVWLHNGILTVNGEKMSKSLGNFITVPEVLKAWPGEVIRWVLLATHYRQPLDWTETALTQGAASLDRLYRALREVSFTAAEGEVAPSVLNALKDDLNTPLALSELHQLATETNKASSPEEKKKLAACLLASGRFMGLLAHDPETWLQREKGAVSLSAAEIEDQIQARLDARSQKNYAAADKIRQNLLQAGVLLEDHATGTRWRRV